MHVLALLGPMLGGSSCHHIFVSWAPCMHVPTTQAGHAMQLYTIKDWAMQSYSPIQHVAMPTKPWHAVLGIII